MGSGSRIIVTAMASGITAVGTPPARETGTTSLISGLRRALAG